MDALVSISINISITIISVFLFVNTLMHRMPAAVLFVDLTWL